MSKKAKIIIGALVAIALVAFTINYVFHGGARDLAAEDTAFTVTSKALTIEFTTDLAASNKKYLEKAVAITGKVTEIAATQIIVDNTVVCSLKTPDTTIKKDQNVIIKGRLVGYDDLMGEIKLDQCFIIKN